MRGKNKKLCVLLLLLVVSYCALAHLEEDYMYIWHVTDPHLDLEYTTGGNPDCEIPLCCETKSANQTREAGHWGTLFARCDIPPRTFQSALDFIKSVNVTPDVIMFGGDAVVHKDWDTDRAFVLGYGKLVADMFRNTFNTTKFANTKLLYTLGNHDTFPVDQFDPNNPGWLLQGLNSYWRQWLSPDAEKSFVLRGYYTELIRPGFRLIVLNTQYQDPINFYLYRNLTDPGNQKAWIQQVLGYAHEYGEKVLILGHIPPGITDGSVAPESIPKYNVDISKIVEKYQSIIVGQFYGHTHEDSFRIFTDSATSNIPTNVAYITPAVTTWEKQNPAVRLLKIDPKTFALVDILTYYANVTEANKSGVMKWQLEYSAREAYGIPDLSPASWWKVVKEMIKDQSKWYMFEKYYRVMNIAGIDCPTGANSCKKFRICNAMNINYDPYTKCLREFK